MSRRIDATCLYARIVVICVMMTSLSVVAVGSPISNDKDHTYAVAVGDLNGDGHLDFIAGNGRILDAEHNRVYLGNGTPNCWDGVVGNNLTSDEHKTRAIVAGDVDGDGDIDVVAGNGVDEQLVNRLYLNDGTGLSWSGCDVGDTRTTRALALGDVDGDGDLDLVTGNDGANYYYENVDGPTEPWCGMIGEEITSDAHYTSAVALGDVDGDGDLDLVVGNNTTNRLYLNNGNSTNPWSAGQDITGDVHNTTSVALGDVDGDGDLDLVAGNDTGTNRLYLNNGTNDPWNPAVGTDITADAHNTYAIALGDVDGDHKLDLVTGNIVDEYNFVYINDGDGDPWDTLSGGTPILPDKESTHGLALGDCDNDGDLDLMAGNFNVGISGVGELNRVYFNCHGVFTPDLPECVPTLSPVGFTVLGLLFLGGLTAARFRARRQ